MEGDPFETVAIAYSQPQARVILSFLEWNAVPAYGANIETARINPSWTLALGGIPIRVPLAYAEETRALLSETADREDIAEGESPAEAPWRPAWRIFMALFQLTHGVAQQPKIGVEIVR